MNSKPVDFFVELEWLRCEAELTLSELVAEIKNQAATELGASRPSSKALQLRKKLTVLDERMEVATKRLQELYGIDEAQIDAIEREGLPSNDNRWWRQQIIETPPSEYLDELAPQAIGALIDKVDPQWLADQATRPFRLDNSFLTTPLQLVGGVRILDPPPVKPPQRFAHMLLVAVDYLNKRDDLDFFSAAGFVPELTALGSRLPAIPYLGAEAIRKFERLPIIADNEVPSTVHELLVGTACVQKGRKIEMLASSGAGKTPDFRLHDTVAPTVIECKRRQGLSDYQLEEASGVKTMYEDLRRIAHEAGLHGIVKVKFTRPIADIKRSAFIQSVMPILDQMADSGPLTTEWGEFSYQRLPYVGVVSGTRLYSPDFLEQVFCWSPHSNDWDGLICEVEPPTSIRVREFRLPFCLKWLSESSEAMTKKARGVTSLWGKAIKQIPPGEIGFIYIAYPEGQRSELADARTRHILTNCADSWHPWSIHVPVIVISRLYARALGFGDPDLIESVLPAFASGEEHWLAQLPRRVFLVNSTTN